MHPEERRTGRFSRAPLREPAEMALELNAPISPMKLELSPNSFVHSVRPAAPATMEPASM